MLEKRYLFRLFYWLSLLTLVFFAGAYQVSATHFAITYVNPINFTTGVQAGTNVQLNIQFNLTNTTELNHSDASGDYFNISNVSIAAIMPNGTEVVLARNATLEATPPSPYGYDTDKHNHFFNIPIDINISVLPVDQEGDIVLNITADVHNYSSAADDFNESITFLGLSFNWDASAPGIKIKFLDTNDNEKTTFQATDKVKIVCTQTAAGASYNDTNISIQSAGGTSFDILATDTTRDTAEREFTVEFSETRELGDYTVACYSIDDLGSINDTENKTFAVVKKPPTGSSPFADPNFKAPVATILISSGSISSLGVLPAEGVSRLIARDGGVSILLHDAPYTIVVKEVGTGSVTYTVANSFDVAVATGETKSVDLTADGQDDVSITLHQVFNKRADTTFALISVQQAPPSQEPADQPAAQPQPVASALVSSPWKAVLFILLTLVIILVVAHFLLARRRSGGVVQTAPPVRFTPRDLGMQRPPEEPPTFTR